MSIQSEINRLNAAKAELKTSIENGGVTVSLNAKIDAYPALVDAITQQIKDKVDAINGEVVEGDVDAKLNKITSTKAAMKSAINGSGSTVGDVFSAYPAAITSGKSAIAQAVTDKGVETAATDTFAQMAANIGQIETGPDILTGILRGTFVLYYWFDGETVNDGRGSIHLERKVAKNSLVFAIADVGAFGMFSVSGGNILAKYEFDDPKLGLRNIMIASITENNFTVEF